MSMNEDRSPIDWDTRFRDGTTPWERPDLHPAFLAWRDSGAFHVGEHVVVPGCGRSPEVLGFAETGLIVSAVDLSPTAIRWQSDLMSGSGRTAELVAGDVLAWTPQAPVDVVYEQTFLCAIPPRLRLDYEAALIRWLKPGGRLFALFMQKEERGGPPYACPLDAMHELFPDSRWHWPRPDAVEPWPHPRLNGKPELGAILAKR